MNLTHRELTHVLLGLRLTQNLEDHDQDGQRLASLLEDRYDLILDGAEPMSAEELDDLCMKINVETGKDPIIYDSWANEKDGEPGFVDRYTVIPYPNHLDKAMRYCFLGCSEGGRAFSQWGELTAPHGDYLGRRVSIDDLDEDTRRHIQRRIEETA